MSLNLRVVLLKALKHELKPNISLLWYVIFINLQQLDGSQVQGASCSSLTFLSSLPPKHIRVLWMLMRNPAEAQRFNSIKGGFCCGSLVMAWDEVSREQNHSCFVQRGSASLWLNILESGWLKPMQAFKRAGKHRNKREQVMLFYVKTRHVLSVYV